MAITASIAAPCASRLGAATMRLPAEVDPLRLPNHVAMIMDGNSRWAQVRGIAKERQLRAAAEACYSNAREIVRLSSDWGIKALTLFAFSTENFLRPREEVDQWMQQLDRVLSLDDPATILLLPRPLQAKISDAQSITSGNTGMKLVMAIGYGGHSDLVQTCQALAREVEQGKMAVEEIDQINLAKRLMLGERCEDVGAPELLVRTSGEQRLSNFMLWHLAYSELVFEKKLWPDFGEEEYKNALVEFQGRMRTFGVKHHS
ncbi:dehydrodolichyl diphosphate synthase 2 [Selaginella moellendorffii]|uniref:dehydrodolichyl diphosphate synthase 2 n=1 Tax=Selaginella moellendorffii TaxID=88036 RepID=UPI000D1C4933|nr:dehydrodolichyl diphosphate synthase 2 [Selaginella moellendorffii]|eukprot:XP_024523921.1 dehydrodolichyl diphosphate synthase 2 [Selaginella moellendorffii]